MRPHLKDNQRKTDWRCGSSHRAPALQVQNPEFKPQSHRKKEGRKEGREGGKDGKKEGTKAGDSVSP
jgi:hypothetical protein